MLYLRTRLIKSNNYPQLLRKMIYPNLRHLRAFVAIAETGSFVAAAEAVHLGQPALSQAISNLESQLGVRLLERTSRSLRLTPAGEEFLVDARRVVESVTRMMERGSDWADAKRGRLELLAVPSVAYRLLPTLVREFKALHPEIEVNVHDHRDAVLRQRLERGEGDLAIVSQSSDSTAKSDLPFLRDRLQVLCPAKHPLSSQESVHASELSDEQLILLRRGAVFRSFADAALNSITLNKAPLEVDQPLTLSGMVEAGLGVALMPAMSCPSAALTSVSARPLSKPDVHRMLAFSLPTGREPMPVVQKFVQVSLAVLEKNPELLPTGCDFLKVSVQKMRRFLAIPRREPPGKAQY